MQQRSAVRPESRSQQRSTPPVAAPQRGPPTAVPHVVCVLGDRVADAMRRRAGLLQLARDMELYGRGVFDQDALDRVHNEADHALDELDATLQRNKINNPAFVRSVMLYAAAITRRDLLRDACERGLLQPRSDLQNYFVALQTDTEAKLRTACSRI